MDYDLAIVGGGPAGLTAGLYAARANMNAMLFDAKGTGGEILNTDLIEDYPGFESVTGPELAEKMAAHAKKFGLKIEILGVKRIRSDGERKILEMVDGSVNTALAVILTTGGEPVKLGVPGEEEFHGRGVSYCAVCDGAFFKGEKLAVIGGGDSAFQEGLFLTRFASKLYLVHRRSEYRAQAILQDRLLSNEKVEPVAPAVVKEIGGDQAGVKWIDVEQDGEKKRIPLGGVFIFVGFTPLGRELFEEHIVHDKDGYLITDQNMRTNIPGVYAAGDCRAQLARQITTAVGDATTAVLHAERYIEELRHARRAFPQAPSAMVAESAAKMDTVHFEPGETILEAGDLPDRLFIITSGRVEILQQVDGAERLVNDLGPGDYFGEIGLLTGARRNATVRAKTPVDLLTLGQDTFATLVRSSQATADELMKVAKARM